MSLIKLSKDNGKQLEVSTIACDQCHKKRIGCNKRLPLCQHCINGRLNCTYSRFIKVNPRQGYDNVERFKIVLNSNKKSLKPSTNRRLKTVSIKFICTTSDWDEMVLRWGKDSRDRLYLYYFSRMMGISINTSSLDDRIFLSRLLLTTIHPKSFKLIMPFHLTPDINTSQLILNQAKEAYFYYFNNFHPLFTYEGYSSRPRSELLQVVVWRIGLQYLPNCPFNLQLRESLNDQIKGLLQYHNLKTSMSTLQSLFAISIGLQSIKLPISNNALFRIACPMIYSLGIHSHSYSFKSHDTCKFNTKFNSKLVDCICMERKFALQFAILLDIRYAHPREFIYVPILDFSINRLMSERSLDNHFPKLNMNNPVDRINLNLLIINHCSLIQEVILRQSYSKFLTLLKAQSNSKILNSILTSYHHRLFLIYRWGFQKLDTTNHLSSTDILLNQLQTKTILLLRFYEAQIILIELHSYIKDDTITRQPHYLKNSQTEFGLTCATSLLNLISKVSRGPFSFLRLNLIMTAAKFIAQHSYLYHHHPTFHLTHLHTTLLQSQSILKELQRTPVFEYEAQANERMVSVLMRRNHIVS